MTYKTTSELIDIMGSITQDEQDDTAMINILNSAINYISIRLGAVLPLISVNDLNSQYLGLPDPYIDIVITRAAILLLNANDDIDQIPPLERKYAKEWSSLSGVADKIIDPKFLNPNLVGVGNLKGVDWTKSLTGVWMKNKGRNW